MWSLILEWRWTWSVVIEERLQNTASAMIRTGWERRAVLEGLELGLGVGVVVRHRWPAVGSGDAEIDEELGDRLEVIDEPRSACNVSLVLGDLLAVEGG